MHAIIKSVYSDEISDLATYTPDDPNSFSFLLRVMVGTSDSEGADSFDIEVCTPEWLSKTFKKEDVLICRHRLIVFEYNFERIIKAITRFINACDGNTWEEVAVKVGRIGRWEFEDYNEYKEPT